MMTGKFWTFNRVAGALAASAIAVGGAGLVGNALAADGTGTANATVVTPISITSPTGTGSDTLRFGSFSTNAAGATVTIGTGGVRLITGGAIGVGSGQNEYGPATFTVSGQANLQYDITLPNDGVVTITTAGGGPTETMAVSAFTSNPSGSGTLTGGSQQLKVGARITTVPSQATGIYTGNFTVTVAYQ